jgi:Rad3-related DNA helicase
MANLLGRSIVRTASMKTGSSAGAGRFVAHESLRDAQDEMISDGIASLGAGGFLLAAAPTGIGKTAAALAAAIEVAGVRPTLQW